MALKIKILIVITFTGYLITISLIQLMNKRIDSIEKALRTYFQKIDYKELDLLFKESHAGKYNPPDKGKDNI